MERLSPELRAKYPNGVHFNEKGFPMFTAYSTHNVEIEMTGVRNVDFARSNQAAGLSSTPDGFTWHHHENGTTM